MRQVLAPLHCVLSALHGLNEARFFLEVPGNDLPRELLSFASVSRGKCTSMIWAPFTRVAVIRPRRSLGALTDNRQASPGHDQCVACTAWSDVLIRCCCDIISSCDALKRKISNCSAVPPGTSTRKQSNNWVYPWIAGTLAPMPESLKDLRELKHAGPINPETMTLNQRYLAPITLRQDHLSASWALSRHLAAHRC